MICIETVIDRKWKLHVREDTISDRHYNGVYSRADDSAHVIFCIQVSGQPSTAVNEYNEWELFASSARRRIDPDVDFWRDLLVSCLGN